MRLVSIGAGELPATAPLAAAVKRSRAAPSIPMTIPGFVQNWPAPIVSEPTNALPRSRHAALTAAGQQKHGVDALISA